MWRSRGSSSVRRSTTVGTLKAVKRSGPLSRQIPDAAEERLGERGLMADGGFTDAGREAREAVEVATDLQCQPIVDALGDDFDELIAILTPWGAQVRDGRGYLPAGPHDLAEAANRLRG